MKRALIATLSNEADSVAGWWACLMRRSVRPDEIAVVDGGSSDGTWETLLILRDAAGQHIPIRLGRKKCNIAEGRNLAIRLTGAVISMDGGRTAWQLHPLPAWNTLTQVLKNFRISCVHSVKGILCSGTSGKASMPQCIIVFPVVGGKEGMPGFGPGAHGPGVRP